MSQPTCGGQGAVVQDVRRLCCGAQPGQVTGCHPHLVHTSVVQGQGREDVLSGWPGHLYRKQIYLDICMSVYLSVCLPACLPICLSVCLVRPSVRPSARLSLSPSVRPSVRLSVRQSLSLSLCPSVCPSVSLSLSFPPPPSLSLFLPLSVNSMWTGYLRSLHSMTCAVLKKSAKLAACLLSEGTDNPTSKSNRTKEAGAAPGVVVSYTLLTMKIVIHSTELPRKSSRMSQRVRPINDESRFQ